MRVFVHQPHFVPWIPYISRLIFADVVIFLDTAQFQEGYFHNRSVFENTQGNRHWLTLPVSGSHGASLLKFNICEPKKLRSASLFLENTYANGREPALRRKFAHSISSSLGRSIADLNIELLEHLVAHLGHGKQFVRASDFDLPNERTQRLVELCRAVGGTTLVNGWGKFATEHDLRALREAKIKISLQSQGKTLSAAATLGPRSIGISTLHDVLRHGAERVAAIIATINEDSHEIV